MGPDPGVSTPRPASVRILSGLLVVEVAAAMVLTGMGLVVAALAAARLGGDTWAGLALVVGLVIAALAALTAAALGLALVSVRRRRGPLLFASLLAHLLPTIAMLVMGLTTGTGQSLVMLGMAVTGLAGIALTVAPPTRSWMRR